MTDAWSNRLSEYLDGELDPMTRRELQQHLAECANCRGELNELRQVVTALDADAARTPPNLWPELSRRLPEARRRMPVRQVRTSRHGWTGGFSLPVAAAAALVFVGILWLDGRRDIGSPRGVDDPAFSSLTPERYGQVQASWLRLVDELALPPEMEAVVREDLQAFDRAVTAAQTALDESPENAALENYLIHTLEAQVRYLSRLRASTERLS